MITIFDSPSTSYYAIHGSNWGKLTSLKLTNHMKLETAELEALYLLTRYNFTGEAEEHVVPHRKNKLPCLVS